MQLRQRDDLIFGLYPVFRYSFPQRTSNLGGISIRRISQWAGMNQFNVQEHAWPPSGEWGWCWWSEKRLGIGKEMRSLWYKAH